MRRPRPLEPAQVHRQADASPAPENPANRRVVPHRPPPLAPARKAIPVEAADRKRTSPSENPPRSASPTHKERTAPPGRQAAPTAGAPRLRATENSGEKATVRYGIRASRAAAILAGVSIQGWFYSAPSAHPPSPRQPSAWNGMRPASFSPGAHCVAAQSVPNPNAFRVYHR